MVYKLYPKQYPSLLTKIYSVPKQLYAVGDLSLLKKTMITVIGTRSMTGYGRWVIRELFQPFLRELDVVVVSGLARGVDGYVHKVCLERGIDTLAIVPGAFESVIPKENRGVYEQIKKKGLVLAEFSRGVKFNKSMFVLRNRLLAGISPTTILIEAAQGSGSLITANFAVEYNREVFTIPGNINQNTSQICNILAKQGAGMITSLDDFKQIFGVQDDQVSLKLSN